FLDQINGRRFERLEKAARQADRDTILLPEQLASSRRETNQARRAECLAIEVRKQDGGRFVIAHELAAVDVPVARAALRGDAPLPTGRSRGRACVRCKGACMLASNRLRAIAWQPVTPVHVLDAQRFLDQQRSEAG